MQYCAPMLEIICSGVRAVDYFITSSLFHTAHAVDVQRQWTEKLYFQAGITTCFDKIPERVSTPISELCGVVTTGNIQPHYYLAPTSPYKMHPLLDAPLARVLTEDPLAILVLVRSMTGDDTTKSWADRIGSRIRKAARRLADEMPIGQSEDVGRRVVVIDGMVRDRYLDFISQGAVLCLPFPTTSAVTTLEAISVGTPFVTYSGSANIFLQHYAPAFLDKLGVDRSCCVAESRDDYATKLLRLGTNSTYRNRISKEFKWKLSRLLGDDACNSVVEDWEKMLFEILPPSANQTQMRHQL